MIYPNAAPVYRDIADHYDDLDKWYLILWGEHVHHGLWRNGNETVEEATRALTDYLVDRMGIREGDQVVDIGCGYGGTSRILAYDHGAHVVGYTLSERQYTYALGKARTPGNPIIHCCNWFENDLPDGFAGHCVSIESSEHMEDKAAFFRETYRVLKPGGRLGVYAWLASDNPTPKQVRRLLEPICREGRLPHLGSEADYHGLFADAGYAGVEFEDLSRQVKRTWPIIVGRMMRRLTWDVAAWRHILRGPNRQFARTVVRIWIAYNTGAMRYGLFTATKPA